MAELLDRLRNVYDDHQDRERQEAQQQGYRTALYETRDALLSSALATHRQWRQELKASRTEANPETIHTKYRARLHGLNDALSTLRQADPGITVQIDIEQFQRTVLERVESNRQERNLTASHMDCGYDYGLSYW